LIHIPATEAKVIENEVQAITKLCEKGAHLHIVRVLKIGELRDTRFLFIDMELCDLNLAEFIHCTRAQVSVPTYFIKDLSPPLKVRQIWNVMLQITKGVKYLHSKDIVHRDLKPANILYSRQDAVWKLADFGFSTEATSRSFRVTTSIRGTQGYFAPEFFGSDQPLYNNKIDIWSMGCILYEFSVGKRAFRHDFATLEYKMTGVLPAITLDEYFSEQCKKAVTESITMMLRVDANSRPTATNLIEEFSRNFEFTLTRTLSTMCRYTKNFERHLKGHVHFANCVIPQVREMKVNQLIQC